MLIRKSEERGKADFGWLKSKHSFSFGRYYDPEHMNFYGLRVINEDIVEGGKGFGEHPHDNMEIITYVKSGALKHKDSSGGEGVIKAGEVQHMSAGKGIFHSEMNASDSEPVHLFQIWIEPKERNIAPTYSQEQVGELLEKQDWVLIASQDDDAVLSINAEAKMYLRKTNGKENFSFGAESDKKIYLHLIKGHISVNGEELETGDALGIEEASIQIESHEDSELLLFELAAE